MADLIFDFDGTLCEGGGTNLAEFIEAGRRHGFRGSDSEAFAALKQCTTDFEVADALAPGNRERQALAQSLVEANHKNLANAFTHLHLEKVLGELARNHDLHVISNRDQQSLDAGLALLGLDSYFEGCIGVSPGVPGKPSLRLYQCLIDKIGRLPSRPIFVGDKDSDFDFANGAGIRFLRAEWFRRESYTRQDNVNLCRVPEDLLKYVEPTGST